MEFTKKKTLTERILEELTKSNWLTTSELARRLDVGRAKLRGFLIEMEDQKLIKSHKVGKAICYMGRKAGQS